MFIVSAPEIRNLAWQEDSHLVLPHLYENKEYLFTYRAMAERGSYLLQDNSLFELKETVGGDLIDFGRQIGASCIMIPEVLRDYRGCLDASEEFMATAALKPTALQFDFAAALQGKSYEDIRSHYVALTTRPEFDRIKVIAIPFNFEFDAIGQSQSEEARQLGWNRFSIVWKLMRDGVWSFNHRHHLLGLYNPIELSYYHPDNKLLTAAQYETIQSNDSSSCYWHSLYNCLYTVHGLAYRKIESHVDFTSHFTVGSQLEAWKYNKQRILSFVAGQGNWNALIGDLIEEAID